MQTHITYNAKNDKRMVTESLDDQVDFSLLFKRIEGEIVSSYRRLTDHDLCRNYIILFYEGFDYDEIAKMTFTKSEDVKKTITKLFDNIRSQVGYNEVY